MADARLDLLKPMSILRKTLIVALFVSLSAVLFTVLLPFVAKTLMAFYGYQSANRTQEKFSASDADKHPAVPAPDTPTAPANQAEQQLDFQPDPVPTPVQPFAIAEDFFMTSWVSITAGLSLSMTAALFLFIGWIRQRLKPATPDGR